MGTSFDEYRHALGNPDLLSAEEVAQGRRAAFGSGQRK